MGTIESGSLPRGRFKLVKSSSLITGVAVRKGPREVALEAEGVVVGIDWGP